MKLSEQMRGVGQVYRFTLIQHLKSRANIVSLIIMLVLAILAVPLSTLMLGGMSGTSAGESIPEISTEAEVSVAGLTELYLYDELGYDIAQALVLPDEVKVTSLTKEMSTEQIDALSSTALYAHVYVDVQVPGYMVQTYAPQEGTLTDVTVEGVSSSLLVALEAARNDRLSGSELLWLQRADGTYAEMGDLDSLLHPEEDVGFETGFAVEYLYAILTLMLCMMSSSYIIRAVVEEKSSKLIDLLMVSVHPLALLCGKVLAMMTAVFGTLLAVFGAGALSGVVCGRVMDTSVIGGGLGEMGISLSMLNLGWETGVIVLISLILSYLTYSLISGIAGASCASMNDMEGAMLGVTFTVLAGYIASCAVAGIPGKGIAIASSLIPFVSSFCAPVQFVLGRIGWPILLLSWLIQSLMVMLLAKLGAKVYRDLILHKGRRLRWRQIFQMARGKGGAA